MTILAKVSIDEQKKLKTKLDESWSLAGTCWVWSGKRNGGGYGVIGKYLVHRLSYALFKQDFRLASFICHTCPPCYNPDHLYEGDSKSNGLDASARGRVRSRPLYPR